MSASAGSALELTLIVAATRNMGIGLKGGLPWEGLKKEMAYFARVTKRVPSQAPSGTLNAVIMGRKTWDSIPEKFRPLKDRLNVVISSFAPAAPSSDTASGDAVDASNEPVRVRSLEEAVKFLEAEQQRRSLGKVFVIGGAQVYGSALGDMQHVARRVLLTKVFEPEFTCDTFFPLALDGPEGAVTEDGKQKERGAKGWKRKDRAALNEWVGEDVPDDLQEEKGIKYEFQLWEKDA